MSTFNYHLLAIAGLAAVVFACAPPTSHQTTNPAKQNASPTTPTREHTMTTDLQRYVTRQNGTEPRGCGAYLHHTEPGVYVDIYTGQPLFSSDAKYDSGSGWPSFYKPYDPEQIKLVEDRRHGMVRTEVRSKSSDAHLGHVFDDGPDPTGKRFCINSAALKFIPMDQWRKRQAEKQKNND